MILEIQHETCLVYSEPVSESMAEVRMEPTSDVEQSCRSFSLRLSPPTEVFRYLDGFGNRVDHFNLLSPHQEVWKILAASVAETRPRPTSLEVCDATWPLDPDSFPLQSLDFPAAAQARWGTHPCSSRCWRRCGRGRVCRWRSWSTRSPTTSITTSATPPTSPFPVRPSTICSARGRGSARTSPT